MELVARARRARASKRGKSRVCGELSIVEFFASLDRVDYGHDSRSLTGRVCGDPMPDRSALYQKQHGKGKEH